jgi:dTDP-4-amino-4,6-dideoxygalactose transaminase
MHEIVSLPMFPQLPAASVGRVVREIRRFFE